MQERVFLNDYDSEPVRYCSKCYSLKIKYDESLDCEFCADCGSSDMLEAPIEIWEEMYEQRYGHKYTVKSNDLRTSPIYKMPLKQLKMKLYEHPDWKKVINSIYPMFPKDLNKEESIIMFFDKLSRDGKMDSFRLKMVELIRKK